MDSANKTCSRCQVANRTEANFCKNCGSLLVESCPRCGSRIADDVNYCDICGLRLVDRPDFSWWLPGSAASQDFPPLGGEPSFDSRTATGPGLNRGLEKAARIVATEPVNQAGKGSSSQPAHSSQLQQLIPNELLDKLEEARLRGEMVGERRVVTMLFCDVVGSTAAAEQLDPEEWTDIINGAFDQMIQPVYKYEGTVARLMGDGLLAFFGAPIAHEDDPQRAVLAGLDIVEGINKYRERIQQQNAIDLNVRVGINTGKVVVGNVGSDLRMEYTAIGDAINLASRMEQSAKPGSVQIAQDTYKLVKNQFEFEDLGAVEVKGKSEPVAAFRVLRSLKGRRRSRGIEGLEVEMVGRQAELEALQKVLAEVKQGLGRIVCIHGEAGVGKSRLVSEGRKILQTQADTEIAWFETASLSYETNQAYGLFQKLVKNVHDIEINASGDDSLQKIRLTLASPSSAEQAGAGEDHRELRFFEAVLGLGNGQPKAVLEGDSFKAELLADVEIWLKAVFSNNPGVLVFEDMHWSDAASVDLLCQLLPLAGEIPVVFLFIMRNDRQAAAWQLKETADEELNFRFHEIALQPLGEAESNELINRLLALPDIPKSLRSSILEKSGGNPFFIEELVRTLIENGVVVEEMRQVGGEAHRYWTASGESADFEIPENLQSLLSARLDRLEESTRATLQVASVIGRTFYHRVLQVVDQANQQLDQQLGTLLKLEMIREAARLPELEYAFRNPLTQEAVYNTILLKNRRNFHLRAGEAIERLYADRLESFYGLLTHHFSLAGVPEKSIEYSRLAARQAANLFAYEEAIQNLCSALSLAEAEGKTGLEISLHEELGDIYHIQRDLIEAISVYNQAADMLVKAEDYDRAILMRLDRKIVQCASEAKWNIDLESYRKARDISMRSRDRLEMTLELPDFEPNGPEQVRAMAALSFEAWRNQIPPDWERAQNYAQRAVKQAETLDDPSVLARALGALANVLDGRSQLREHASIAEQRLQISTDARMQDQGERLEALSGAGMAWMYVGEYEQALTILRETENLAVELHNVGQQVAALGLQGQCYYRLDRWDEVLRTEEKWRELEGRYSRQRVGPT